MKILLVLLLSFVTNVLWAFYIKNVANSNRLKGAIFGELIIISGAFITYNFIRNVYLIIPMIIGGFLGTYFADDIKKL